MCRFGSVFNLLMFVSLQQLQQKRNLWLRSMRKWKVNIILCHECHCPRHRIYWLFIQLIGLILSFGTHKNCLNEESIFSFWLSSRCSGKKFMWNFVECNFLYCAFLDDLNCVFFALLQTVSLTVFVLFCFFVKVHWLAFSRACWLKCHHVTKV